MFYLSDNIDNETIGQICFNLLALLQEDDKKELKEKDFVREPIKFYINSFGGSIYDMWALIDIMFMSKTPIYTYCTGYAMSAGFEIFLAGHKRYCTKHATFLYHQLSSGVSGKIQDMQENIEENEYLQTESEEYVRQRTKIPKRKLDNIRTCKLDVYIHADEALELGIVDEII